MSRMEPKGSFDKESHFGGCRYTNQSCVERSTRSWKRGTGDICSSLSLLSCTCVAWYMVLLVAHTSTSSPSMSEKTPRSWPILLRIRISYSLTITRLRPLGYVTLRMLSLDSDGLVPVCRHHRYGFIFHLHEHTYLCGLYPRHVRVVRFRIPPFHVS